MLKTVKISKVIYICHNKKAMTDSKGVEVISLYI